MVTVEIRALPCSISCQKISFSFLKSPKHPYLKLSLTQPYTQWLFVQIKCSVYGTIPILKKKTCCLMVTPNWNGKFHYSKTQNLAKPAPNGRFFTCLLVLSQGPSYIWKLQRGKTIVTHSGKRWHKSRYALTCNRPLHVERVKKNIYIISLMS